MPSPDVARSRKRRVHFPWRVSFALYTVAMMIGMHWPRLELGVGEVPAPDKIIHFIAFAGLAFLLWSTGWMPRLSVLWLITMTWALLAEFTQAIPIFGRSFSWMDIIAGWLGASSVVIWLWALGPAGDELNRLRLRLDRFVVQELFTRRGTWALAGIAGGLLAIVLGGCAWALLIWNDPFRPRFALTGAMLGALAGSIAGVFAMTDSLVRRRRDSIAAQRPCFNCGESCADAVIDESGYGLCPHCGNGFHLGQWTMRADLPRAVLSSMAIRAAWLALLLGAAAVAFYLSVILTHRHAPEFLAMVVRTRGVTDDFRLAIDVAVASAIVALAVRTFRTDVARRFDRQGDRCRACGHDVHATPVEHGLGRCGECGTMFVRA